MAKPKNKSKSHASPIAQNAGTGQKLLADRLKEASTNGNAAQIAMPSIEESQVENLEKGESEKKQELEKILEEFTEALKNALELRESEQKRSDELTRKEEAFFKRSEENKNRAEELDKRKKELDQQQTELKKAESQQTDRERDLELRELDARTGFAKQNSVALDELKQEIATLESRRNELQLELHQTEQKALDEESARSDKFMEREAEIAGKNRKLQQDQRRLNAELKELEHERTQIFEAARLEATQEIERHDHAKQQAESRLKDMYAKLASAQEDLKQYEEFSVALAGRSARDVMDELLARRREITRLENQIATNQDDQLQAENNSLRQVRDELKGQLDKVNQELAETKAQLQRLRLGVSDKENLEKEKRALEKHNQILSARLNDLGETVDDLTRDQQSEQAFPEMVWMDSASSGDWIDERKAYELELTEQDVPDLEKFSRDLQQGIATAEKLPLYFDLEDIRLLIAGLAMSQLHIFQGISGTGKTSLAKAFAKAMGGYCTDIAVQAGWRDRDDLLGHYNAFEKRFYERECLQGLYRAQTDAYKNRCNVILLDEMNLSRPEQYFAEFLSALEKNDSKERLINLSESALLNAPKKLKEGRKILISDNVWFIGTANHDETTNEFADKTYDRAHVMTLPRHETNFNIDTEVIPKNSYSHHSLMKRFNEAEKQHKPEVRNLLDEMTTGQLTAVLQNRFDIGWGNRFERQAMRFVPVFMATGGSKEDALDHLLATRVFRRGKVTGRYDATIDDLAEIEKSLKALWKGWKSEPRRSLALLSDDRRRKERGA
ncbi:hypothetical protein AGMMS49545_16210 [Betaproteobacteria bacterium]|nr:hypothetical protein AGMMS49545_16210 [Betaproteobacteria bacterium]GHU42072.1 hypothetical protein AGMMS50289_06190 [Betaproteobacteria bacterium]